LKITRVRRRLSVIDVGSSCRNTKRKNRELNMVRVGVAFFVVAGLMGEASLLMDDLGGGR
jgi:hypothetical protein